MRVLIAAVYDQLPGTNVGSYMNVDRNRLISDEDSLLDVAHKFQETPYRRLPVLYGEKLGGQVSRRDVLRAEHRLATEVLERSRKPNADANRPRVDNGADGQRLAFDRQRRESNQIDDTQSAREQRTPARPRR